MNLAGTVRAALLALAATSSGTACAATPRASTPCERSCAELCVYRASECESRCDATGPIEEGNTGRTPSPQIDRSEGCRADCRDREHTCERTCASHCNL